MFLQDMRHDFRYEWIEAVLLALETTTGKGQADLPMQEYQECLAELRMIQDLPRGALSLLEDINDGAWLRAAPRHDHELALIELYDNHHDKREIALLTKNSSITALLADKWKMSSASGKNGGTSARATKMTWEQLCFAVIWRRVTMQAEWKNIELKMQVHSSVCQTRPHTKDTTPSSVKAYKKMTEICEAAILEPAAEKAKMMKKCCAQMEKSYDEQSKGDGGTQGDGKARDDDDEDMNSQDDDGDDDDEGEDDVDWRKEMRRHLDACLEMSNELTEQIRMYECLNEDKEKRTAKQK